MNILLIILGVIVGIIVLILIIALFSKKSYSINRQVVVDRPRSEVYEYLRFLKNQDHYNKWARMDPNMKKEYRGTDGAVGFVYAWEGNAQAGKGEQEIIALTPDSLVDIEVRFERPFKAVAKTPLALESVPGNDRQTKITWGMSNNMKYPMNAILLFMNMDKALGKDLEESLGMLKGNLEK